MSHCRTHSQRAAAPRTAVRAWVPSPCGRRNSRPETAARRPFHDLGERMMHNAVLKRSGPRSLTSWCNWEAHGGRAQARSGGRMLALAATPKRPAEHQLLRHLFACPDALIPVGPLASLRNGRESPRMTALRKSARV